MWNKTTDTSDSCATDALSLLLFDFISHTLDCVRYSKYLEFPELTAAQVRDIDSKLENMLLKLDEFNAVFERVRILAHSPSPLRCCDIKFETISFYDVITTFC